jgi:AraC-like DNA-binding protein
VRDSGGSEENRQDDGCDSVHEVMLAPSSAWTLERNDRRLLFAAGPEMALFGESAASHVTRHRHPVWKVVLPVDGLARIQGEGHRPTAAAGLIVPPELTHTCAVSSAYLALFVDPTLLHPGLGLVRLDTAMVRRLHAALGLDPNDGSARTPDLAAAYTELVTRAAAAPSLDARVAHAVRRCTLPGHDLPIPAIAAEVGLSAARLRTLVRTSVGVPLARLRRWGRLRAAITVLPGRSVAAAAADAGFADQAHLTRTARGLLGRTPLSLTKGAPAARHGHRRAGDARRSRHQGQEPAGMTCPSAPGNSRPSS